MRAARCIAAALKGPGAIKADWTVEEETGWLLIADAVACLRWLRDANTKKD